MKSLRMLFAIMVLLCIAPISASANIYLDEDFEGESIFVDRNWPIRDNNLPISASLDQGVNLRAYSNSETSPKVNIGTKQGSVVSTRSYKGTKSYRLQSGQALAVTPGQFPTTSLDGFRFWQFALNVDSATAQLASSTLVGSFKIDFSTNNSNPLSAEVTAEIRLVTNNSGQVSVVCANNGAFLGSLSGAADDWMVVSVVANSSLAESGKDTISSWRAYDPVTGQFKGPDFNIPTGVVIYGKKSDSILKTSLNRAGFLGADWNKSTNEVGWRFEAKNSGTIYLDNLYWDARGHGGETGGMDTEQAARMERAVPLMLSPMFTDNGVLQRDVQVPIWGWADPNALVTVYCGDKQSTVRANGTGSWKAILSPSPAGGPYELRAISGNAEAKRSNVMFGDVWFCSGQSNMHFELIQSTNGAAEVAAANHPNIRLLMLPWTPSDAPLQNISGGLWQPCIAGSDQVTSFSAVAYYFGRELQVSLGGNVPIGLINSSVGATRAEDWTSLEALQGNSEFAPLIGTPAAFGASVATYLFNGMVKPVMPYAIKGAIWYQGEANANGLNRALGYRRVLPLMINDWRSRWGSEFPFILVQLPLFNTTDQWAELRESQLLTLTSTRNTGMAIALDHGDPNDIHPRNKLPVGQRLARVARAKAYGENITYSGPLFQSQIIEGNQIRVTFTQVGTGLTDRNGGALQGFQIAGSNKAFVTATATIDGSTVLVSAPSVASPQYVRYAWASNPAADLFNAEGLPASPFRTDLASSGGATPTPYPTPTPTPETSVSKVWKGYR